MICDVAFRGVAWNRQCKMRNTAAEFERGRKATFYNTRERRGFPLKKGAPEENCSKYF
jgi:hypothetical protein